MMRFASALLIGGAILTSTTAAFAQDVDWQKVDEALGRKAAVVAGDVHRYGFPRTDLAVTLDGVTIKPALALGGWVAFKADGWRSNGDGRSGVAGNRDQTRHDEDDRERPRHHRGPQPPAARQSGHLLHARRRSRRSGQIGDCHPHGTCRKQDATHPTGGSGSPTGDRSRYRATRPDHRRQRPSQRRRLSVRRRRAAIR